MKKLSLEGYIWKAELEKKADFKVENHGSLFLVTPLHLKACQHLTENIGEDSQWFGNALVVEHRYIENLVYGLQEHGFTVQ